MKKRKAEPKAKQGADWPANKVAMWPVSKIKPYALNPRTHPVEQITMLAEMMKRYGVDQPIVVDNEGVILKGHGRRLAALSAGFERYPVVIHRGLSDDEKRAMRIEDNQTILLAGWDEDLLRQEIMELNQADYPVELLGFSQADLAKYLQPPELPADPDAVVEPVKNPAVRQGDVWQLGDHRLVCGDSTQKDTWDALMTPTERAALVFTDPPYGVSYTSGRFDVIEGDHKRRDDLYKMLVAALRQMAARATDGAAFYIWHASSTREDFSQAMKAAGLAESQYLIWVKPSIVMGHADYQWMHEPCIYGSKAGGKPTFYGPRTEATVWHVQTGGNEKDVAATIGNGVLLLDGNGAQLFVQARAPKNKKLRQIRITDGGSAYLSGSERQDGTVWEVTRDGQHIHPTQKPVELARRAIENSSKPGEIVVDGFAGSGVIFIAAEMTGRRARGVELDPIYAHGIIERWEKFTGGKAINAATGKTLAQTASARRKR